MQRGSELLVLDEVGPMELAGHGWSQVISKLEKNHETPQIWVVRERILDEVTDRWQIPIQNIFHAETADEEKIVERILEIGNLRP